MASLFGSLKAAIAPRAKASPPPEEPQMPPINAVQQQGRQGWERYSEPGTGRVWYWNAATSEARWDEEPDPDFAAADVRVAGSEHGVPVAADDADAGGPRYSTEYLLCVRPKRVRKCDSIGITLQDVPAEEVKAKDKPRKKTIGLVTECVAGVDAEVLVRQRQELRRIEHETTAQIQEKAGLRSHSVMVTGTKSVVEKALPLVEQALFGISQAADAARPLPPPGPAPPPPSEGAIGAEPAGQAASEDWEIPSHWTATPSVAPGLWCDDPAETLAREEMHADSPVDHTEPDNGGFWETTLGSQEETHADRLVDHNQPDIGGFWDTTLDSQETHADPLVDYNQSGSGGFWDTTLDSQYTRQDEMHENVPVATAGVTPASSPIDESESLDRLPGRWRKTREQAADMRPHQAPPFAKPPPPGCDFSQSLQFSQDTSRVEPPAVAPPAPPAAATHGYIPAVSNSSFSSISKFGLGPAPTAAPPEPPCSAVQTDTDEVLEQEDKIEENLQSVAAAYNNNEEHLATLDEGLDDLDVLPPAQHNGVDMPLAGQVSDNEAEADVVELSATNSLQRTHCDGVSKISPSGEEATSKKKKKSKSEKKKEKAAAAAQEPVVSSMQPNAVSSLARLHSKTAFAGLVNSSESEEEDEPNLESSPPPAPTEKSKKPKKGKAKIELPTNLEPTPAKPPPPSNMQKHTSVSKPTPPIVPTPKPAPPSVSADAPAPTPASPSVPKYVPAPKHAPPLVPKSTPAPKPAPPLAAKIAAKPAPPLQDVKPKGPPPLQPRVAPPDLPPALDDPTPQPLPKGKLHRSEGGPKNGIPAKTSLPPKQHKAAVPAKPAPAGMAAPTSSASASVWDQPSPTSSAVSGYPSVQKGSPLQNLGKKSAFSALTGDDSDDENGLSSPTPKSSSGGGKSLAALLAAKKAASFANGAALSKPTAPAKLSSAAYSVPSPKAKSTPVQGKAKAADPLPQRSHAPAASVRPMVMAGGLVAADTGENAASGRKWNVDRPVEKVVTTAYEEEDDPELACYLWDRKAQRPRSGAAAARAPAPAAAPPSALFAGPPLRADKPSASKQRQLLGKVMEMGFDEASARRALVQTGWTNVEDAVMVLV